MSCAVGHVQSEAPGLAVDRWSLNSPGQVDAALARCIGNGGVARGEPKEQRRQVRALRGFLDAARVQGAGGQVRHIGARQRLALRGTIHGRDAARQTVGPQQRGQNHGAVEGDDQADVGVLGVRHACLRQLRTIRDPAAYILRSIRDAAAKAHGVPTSAFDGPALPTRLPKGMKSAAEALAGALANLGEGVQRRGRR